MRNGGGLLTAAAAGACALLALKVVGLLQYENAAPAMAPVTVAAPLRVAEAPFDKAAARIKAGLPRDPDFTGSVPKPEPKKDEPPPSAPADPSLNKAGVFEGKPPLSPAEKALYERLGERREQLDGRAQELDAREKLLEGAEKRLENRIGDLKATEEKMAVAVQKSDPANAALKNLVVMYEAMKPKDAARVFDRLTHEVLVPVVTQMNPRKMSEVLAAMSPEAAERLTVALAQRSAAEGRPAAAPLPPNELPALKPQR